MNKLKSEGLLIKTERIFTSAMIFIHATLDKYSSFSIIVAFDYKKKKYMSL